MSGESRHLFLALTLHLSRWGLSGATTARPPCRTRPPGPASSTSTWYSWGARSTFPLGLEKNCSRLEKLKNIYKIINLQKVAHQLKLDIDDKFIQTLKRVTQVSLSLLSLSLTELIRSLEWVWGTAPWQTVASSTFSSSIWQSLTFSLANNSRYAELSLQGKLKSFLWTQQILFQNICLRSVLFKVQSLQNINKYSENLQSLQVGVQVLPHYLQPEVRGENVAETVDNDNVVARLRDKLS